MCFSQESQTYIVCSPHIWKNIVSCLSSVPVFYGEKASPASRRILSKLEGETIFIYSLQLNNFLCAQSLQLCSTLCDPMDCSPPNSSVHGILQARILEWIAMPSKVWIILVVFFLFVTIILKDTVMRHTTLIVNCKSAVFGYISFTKGLSVVNIYSPV